MTKVEYIKQTIPPTPIRNEYYNVQWQKHGELYCIDGHNAKNMLKNKVLQDGRERDLEEIIESLR